MSRSGLGKWGITPPTPVRSPAQQDDHVVCPECGTPVGASKGTQYVQHPDLVDDDLDVRELIVFGWACHRHAASVILPVNAGGPGSPALQDGWSSVKLRLADGRKRHVPVPKSELPDWFDPTEGSR